MNLKKYWLLISFPFLMGCNGNSSETVAESKLNSDSISSAVINSLKAQLQKTTSTVQLFMKSFNEIEENLNKIRSKEQRVALSSQSKAIKGSEEEQIINDIKFIDDLLDKNRQSINGLNEQLKDSSVKILELENTVSVLDTRITEKEKEIKSLKNTLAGMNIKLTEMDAAYQKVKKESDAKTEALNTAYCAIGSFNDLKKHGIINATGGFIGIGKVGKLNTSVNKGMYSAIDIYQTKEFTIASKKIKLLSMHPEGTYELDTKYGVKSLKITNPDEFWKTSRFLIIEASAGEPEYE